MALTLITQLQGIILGFGASAMLFGLLAGNRAKRYPEQAGPLKELEELGFTIFFGNLALEELLRLVEALLDPKQPHGNPWWVAHAALSLAFSYAALRSYRKSRTFTPAIER